LTHRPGVSSLIGRMSGKTGRIFLLVLLTVWYAAVLPAHTRGVVQLPGTTDEASTGCCNHESSKKSDAPAKPATNCAVCHYMAALSAPPPLDHGIALLKPADVLRDVIVVQPTSARIILPYHGRAPPAV
jgi:hypothetical protein